MKMIAIAAMLFAILTTTDSRFGGRPVMTTTVVCSSARDQYNYNTFGIIGPSCVRLSGQ